MSYPGAGLSEMSSQSRGSGYMWQPKGWPEESASPKRPPSPECEAKPELYVPHQDIVDYRLANTSAKQEGPFKAAVEQGRVRLVSQWRQGFHGRGAERYQNGSIYVGEYQDARRHGRGTITTADGSLMVSFWKANRPFGEGAKWNADHTSAIRTYNGKEDDQIELSEAGAISARLGLPCPGGWAGSRAPGPVSLM